MRKPSWISFCGWASFGLLLFWVSVVVISTLERVPPIPLAWGGMAAIFALPLFGLWLLGSIVHRFQVSSARIKAQALMEAQAKTAAAAGRLETWLPNTGSVPPPARTATR